MITKITDGPILAEKCRRAVGSLHCELPPREKRVIESIIRYSFDLGQDAAMFGASKQIALEWKMDEADVSNALSSLRRTRLIRQERANPLRHFRRPMLYFLDPQALLRVCQEPALGAGADFVERMRAETAKWLAHANRQYPLQPELLPPDPNEFELAFAEIARASVLAHNLSQNGEPKSAPNPAGEATPPERTDGPGLTLRPSVTSVNSGDPSPVAGLDPDYVRSGREQGFSDWEIARIHAEAHRKDAAEDEALVGNFPTGNASSWKFSNHSCARDQISSDNTDGENNLSIRTSDKGDARGPVGNFPTGNEPGPLARVLMMLTELGEPWQPPSPAQEVFDELSRCMGAAAMANYSPWWWPQCVDPKTRRDVVETIATWKLARHHPRHKPWRGGTWRREFFRRQNARLAASGKEETHA